MDDLKAQALAEIETPAKMYLAELGYLIEAGTPEERETFELTAQNRLNKLREAINEARQKYEVPLLDEEVINHGLKALGQTHGVLKADSSPQGRQLVGTLETTLKAILNNGSTTLPGLLASARDYQLPSQYLG